MNNSKIWLVVNPTVGIPLFLGAVAVSSFAVHVAVVTNTGWVSDYLSGNELGTTVAARDADRTVLPARADARAPGAAPLYIDAAAQSADGALVILSDGSTARLVVESGPERISALE